MFVVFVRKLLYLQAFHKSDVDAVCDMNLLDLFILAPILWGAHKGYERGFLLTFLSMISFFVALVLGFKFYHVTMRAIAPSINVADSWLPYIAFFITFGLIWYAIHKLGNYMKGVLDTTLLGSFDNLIGAGVGALKFAFFASIFLWLFNSLRTFDDKVFADSLLYRFVEPVAPYVIRNTSKIVLAGQDILEETKNTLQLSPPPKTDKP